MLVLCKQKLEQQKLLANVDLVTHFAIQVQSNLLDDVIPVDFRGFKLKHLLQPMTLSNDPISTNLVPSTVEKPKVILKLSLKSLKRPQEDDVQPGKRVKKD